jgi:DNA replicative helicase MCM subunit Mcm2 (Cdc46/Mcm family)
MGIFSVEDKVMTAEKVRKELVRLYGIILAHKKVIVSVERDIKYVQSKCPHEVVSEFDYDPRFIPKKICNDCGAEV